MSTLLAVKAHPLMSEDSKSMKVFYAFLDSYKKSNPEDEIIVLDLYNEDFPEIDLDILTGWNDLRAGTEFSALTANQQQKIARFNESTEQFLAADKVSKLFKFLSGKIFLTCLSSKLLPFELFISSILSFLFLFMLA